FRSMNVNTDHRFRENGASNKRAFISDGRMKVSTIHGFKGWEARSVIILIPDRWGHEENLDAVIYTAITRTLENLIILNTNERYLEFYENDDDVEIPDISEDEMDPELEEWIETLPYPLASIIWESMTVTSYESRVRYLIHFFEALAEFNFNLIISGLSSNELFFDMRAREAFQGVKNNLERPTFGYWTTLLFKAIRSLRMALKDRYHKNQVHKSFGKPGDDFLNALASANLPLILKNVLRYRNIWEGHGPRVSEEEYRKRYSVLIGELRKVRDVIGNTYSHAFLVIPSEGILDGGVHRYTAKRYMTTRAPFRAVKLESEEPMDSNSIYLANPNKRRHLELLPLIINNDDTCYFYNGIDDETGKARYCSYHNKDKAEIFVNPPRKILNLQEMLNPTDPYN
ncbi:MAG: ATP-binding domain-containing protein, partial [Methanothermobacter sp.]|nr:ATP-binding domain-containing protein [Methanothermobacter sp.]